MKKLITLFLCIIVSAITYSQPWLTLLPKNKSAGELTFYDYQNAFYSYWDPYNVVDGYYEENGIRKKATGWKQFKRWEHEMEGKINPRIGEFPRQTGMQVYNEFIRKNPPTRTAFQGNWTALGPDYSYSGYSGVGRINCVAFHPTDLNTYWVGAAAGGLWMTTNDGSTWECLTNELGVLAVSDIIIHPGYDTTGIIYIATGDRDSWDNRSIGVMKSNDHGNTWTETGVAFTIYEGRMVNRLLMDPTNQEVLYAATSNGLYKTIDGGATWDTQLFPWEFIDMEFKPGDPSTMYGSTKSGSIFLSTTAGLAWEPVYEDVNAGRIELAISANQPSWVYAVMTNGSALYGIYKSINSGRNFDLVFDGAVSNLLTWDASGEGDDGQGWYDLALAASPSDANILLVGGINTWRSLDGGLSWTIVNHWYGAEGQEVHADKHMLKYRADGTLFETNDGGIYVSYNDGTNWVDKTNGIQISQMYRLGVSQSERFEVITGLQDNGTKLLSGHEWTDHIGGDGMECIIDYTNVNIQYGTLYNGIMKKTEDHWATDFDITPPDDGAWVTPFVIDPVNPQILYGGYSEIWRTFDGGYWWEPISFFNSFDRIRSMAIAPSNNQVLYAATNSRMWKTTDAGGNWIEVNSNLPVSDGNIEYITIKHNDPNTVWVTLGGYTVPGVYESTDGGLNWTNISEGLPPIPAYTVVQNKLFAAEPHLFAGTEVGVYFKKGNQPWTRFNDGLPNVEIGELEIYYASDVKETMLRAATYGRGLWETPVLYSETPVSYAAPDSTVCNGNVATINVLSSSGNIQWQQSPDGINEWQNVTGGIGANTEAYTTEELVMTTCYRAEVIEPGIDTAYSNVTTITVIEQPDTIGIITGDTIVCQGDYFIEYSIEPIANASSYVWTLPNGFTGSSTTESIVVSFESFSNSGFITVVGKNEVCEGEPSSLSIEVNPQPETPNLDAVIQPSCTDPTGEIVFEDLPSEGEWTLMDLSSGATIINSGSTFAIAELQPGVYEYSITNEFGCTSSSSISVIIDEQPVTPPTPTISATAYVLHSDASAGNQWYNEHGIINGATGQDYIVTESGDYFVIVNLGECDSEPSNVISLEIGGIDLDSIFVQGVYRTFIVHLPEGYNEKDDHALVINMHGLNSNAGQQQVYSQFDAIADAENFIVVYPNAINKSWDLAGDTDANFIEQLIDTLKNRYSINNCLFLTGMSMGGFMSYKLACELPTSVTAIAVVTGNMPTAWQITCNAPFALPVIHFHGTEDAVVSYNGSFGILPVEETVQWWAEENNCEADPDTMFLPDIDPNDNSIVEQYQYSDCEGDSEVALYKVVGGGHTWPGTFDVPPLGVTNHDINASSIIGTFFSSHCTEVTAVEASGSIHPALIYPNPAGEYFEISFTGKKADVFIYDLMGHKIEEHLAASDRIEINSHDFLPGLYLVRISMYGKLYHEFVIISK